MASCAASEQRRLPEPERAFRPDACVALPHAHIHWIKQERYTTDDDSRLQAHSQRNSPKGTRTRTEGQNATSV